jgi:ribosome-binding factor A
MTKYNKYGTIMDKEQEELTKEIAQRKSDKPKISDTKLISEFLERIELSISTSSAKVFVESLSNKGVLISYANLIMILHRLRKKNNLPQHKANNSTRQTNQQQNQNVQTSNKGENQKPEIKKPTLDPNMSIRAMRIQSEKEQAEDSKVRVGSPSANC